MRAIVADYVRRLRPRAEEELAYYRDLASDETAVSQAALARRASGRRHPHQYRIPYRALEECQRRLLDQLPALRASGSFEELLDMVALAIGPVRGIGELTIYDTALRIGARFNLEPTKIYMHAGTRQGAKALGLPTGGAIEMAELPPELQALTPSEAEDVLCIYKHEFTETVHPVAKFSDPKLSTCT